MVQSLLVFWGAWLRKGSLSTRSNCLEGMARTTVLSIGSSRGSLACNALLLPNCLVIVTHFICWSVLCCRGINLAPLLHCFGYWLELSPDKCWLLALVEMSQVRFLSLFWSFCVFAAWLVRRSLDDSDLLILQSNCPSALFFRSGVSVWPNCFGWGTEWVCVLLYR